VVFKAATLESVSAHERMKNFFLPVALAVILGSAWVVWKGGQPDRMPQVMDEWPMLEVAQVRGLRLDSGKGELSLNLSNGSWFVADEIGKHPANQRGVEMLLRLLGDMRQMRVVTRSPRMHASLGVASGARVTVLDGEGRTLLDLFVGRGGANLLSTYVRKADEDTVYAVDRLLGPLLESPRDFWLPEVNEDVPGEDRERS